MTSLSKLKAICQSRENAGKGYRCASINQNTFFRNNEESKTLQVGVVSSNKIIPEKAEERSAEIARIIFKEYPEASNNENIQISLINAVDLWIFATGKSVGFSHSPAEWKKIISEQTGDGLKI